MADIDKDKCNVKHCRRYAEIYYYGVPLCDEHWTKFTESKTPDELKKLLGIKEKKVNI